MRLKEDSKMSQKIQMRFLKILLETENLACWQTSAVISGGSSIDQTRSKLFLPDFPKSNKYGPRGVPFAS